MSPELVNPLKSGTAYSFLFLLLYFSWCGTLYEKVVGNWELTENYVQKFINTSQHNHEYPKNKVPFTVLLYNLINKKLKMRT